MTNDKSVFQLLTDQINVGIALFLDDGQRCIYLNNTAREVLELSEETPISSIKTEAFCPTETKGDYPLFSQEKFMIDHYSDDVLMLKGNSRLFIARVAILPIHFGGKIYRMLTILDVTFQKKMERELTLKQAEIKKTYEELLEQNKQLKELDRAKDKFIALTTHELRTPLSAVLATADVLFHKLYDDEVQLRDFIETIYYEGQHLLTIVNDILDFSKIQAGKMDFFIENLDPTDLVSGQLRGFENMASARKIKMNLHQAKSPPLCWHDPVRTSQITANIINNAIKFNREAGEVNVTISQDDLFVTIEIADQGVGIAPENFDKIFNEFETVGNVKTHQKGTGLGMPISKKLAEAMGGSLTFTSEVGKGTSFALKLPKQKVLAEEFYRARPKSVDDLAA